MQDLICPAGKISGFQGCSLDKGKIMQGLVSEGKQADSYF